jgi:hypothetical protein
MGSRGTLVLAALLLVVGVFAYFDAISGERNVSLHSILGELRPTPRGQNAPKLLHYEPADIVAIHLQKGAVDLRVKRRDGTWVGASRPDALDDFLVNLLTLAKIMTVDVKKQDLADHGLDPPEAVVEMQGADGSTISIRIGSHNPPLTGVYVQVGPSDRVILTGALLLWELEKAIDAASPTG